MRKSSLVQYDIRSSRYKYTRYTCVSKNSLNSKNDGEFEHLVHQDQDNWENRVNILTQ